MSIRKRWEPAFREGETVLHATRSFLATTSFCGAYVDMIGVPPVKLPPRGCGYLSVCRECDLVVRRITLNADGENVSLYERVCAAIEAGQ